MNLTLDELHSAWIESIRGRKSLYVNRVTGMTVHIHGEAYNPDSEQYEEVNESTREEIVNKMLPVINSEQYAKAPYYDAEMKQRDCVFFAKSLSPALRRKLLGELDNSQFLQCFENEVTSDPGLQDDWDEFLQIHLKMHLWFWAKANRLTLPQDRNGAPMVRDKTAGLTISFQDEDTAGWRIIKEVSFQGNCQRYS